jgi:hypothetical protein
MPHRECTVLSQICGYDTTSEQIELPTEGPSTPQTEPRLEEAVKIELPTEEPLTPQTGPHLEDEFLYTTTIKPS